MSVQLDVIFDGQALLDQGLMSSYNALSGVGLNTFGFILSSSDIWSPDFTQFPVPGITTIWTIEYLPY